MLLGLLLIYGLLRASAACAPGTLWSTLSPGMGSTYDATLSADKCNHLHRELLLFLLHCKHPCCERSNGGSKVDLYTHPALWILPLQQPHARAICADGA